MLNLQKKNCSAVACMYVCSLLEKECPCRLCSIPHVTVTWGRALQVTVSTSNSFCCPLQLFRVVAHWVVIRSWSLVRLNTSLERSVEPPLASMCSLDKEKVFSRIDNAETSTSRETTRSPARRFAARWLLVSCPPGTMVSSYRRHLFPFWLPTVPAVSSERRITLLVSYPSAHQESLESDEPPGSCYHCSSVSLERRAAICISCQCLTRLVFASVITSSIGNTKGKLFTKKSNCEHLFDLLLHAAGQYRQRRRSQHLFRSRFARSLAPARWPARQSISECSAGKRVRPISCEQTTNTDVSQLCLAKL